MSVASTQCQILALTSRKSDLEYRLLCINAVRSRMAAQTSALHEDLVREIQSGHIFQTVDQDSDIEQQIAIATSGEFYTAYQLQTAMINEKEKMLDVEKTQIETQLNAINTLQDSLSKQLESDLKKSVLNV